MKISELEGKRVAIWGYGREGRAAFAALRWRLPRAPLALIVGKAEAAEAAETDDPALYVFTEAPTADLLARFEVVIKSPGISPYSEVAVEAAARGVQFTSATALWAAENPDARTICVTGTKGKSTTTALIAHLLRSAGHRTALAGNIGMPLLELLDTEPPPEYWAIELSSFQTRELTRPEVAVVLNLYPEHLDWHGSEASYFADKLALITAGEPETVVLNAADPRLMEVARRGIEAHWFNALDGWHLRGQILHRGEQAVMDTGSLPLPGTHNRGNLCAALTAIEALGLDAIELAPAAKTFRPLPHRLQSLGVRDGVEYVNDSISTTPYASLAALDHCAGRRVAIIVGGFDRGLDWGGFVERLSRDAPLAVVCTGQNGSRIAEALVPAARNAHFALLQATELPEAVRAAERALNNSGVVLLSPGAPSFPRYRDYTERGRHFAEAAGFDAAQIVSIPGLGIS